MSREPDVCSEGCVLKYTGDVDGDQEYKSIRLQY